MQFGLTARSIG